MLIVKAVRLFGRFLQAFGAIRGRSNSFWIERFGLDIISLVFGLVIAYFV